LPAAVDRLLHRMSGAIDVLELQLCAGEFLRLHTQWFSSPHDASRLWGEDNLLWYRPLPELLVLADLEMSPRELGLIVLAAATTQCPVALFTHPESPAVKLALELGAKSLPAEASAFDAALYDVIAETVAPRLRTRGALGAVAAELAHQRAIHVIEGAVSVSRFELLHGLREQSVSVSYHRHGHMGLRGLGH
jgi:hypothetical protein